MKHVCGKRHTGCDRRGVPVLCIGRAMNGLRSGGIDFDGGAPMIVRHDARELRQLREKGGAARVP